MSHENPFWVDIPQRSCVDDENGSWEHIATFDTRAEAVAFVREHFQPDADERGNVTLITGGEADEQVPESKEVNAELLEACKAAENWLTEYETGPDTGLHGLLEQLRKAINDGERTGKGET